MSWIDLVVPFAEKDEAKALGARWDGITSVWYVPGDKDPTPCWQCKGVTRVHGFILSGSYEVSEWIEGEDDDDDGNIVWNEWTDTTVLSYVRGLPDAVIQRVKQVSPTGIWIALGASLNPI